MNLFLNQKCETLKEIFINGKSNLELEIDEIDAVVYFKKNNNMFAAIWFTETNCFWYDGTNFPIMRFKRKDADEVIALFDEKEKKLLLFNLDLFL